MRGLLLLLALFSSCENGAEKAQINQQEPVENQFQSYPDYPEHFDAAWVMTKKMSFTMGAALAIKNDEYFYWFWSHMSSEIFGPYRGKWRIEDDCLVLNKLDDSSCLNDFDRDFEPDLLETKWHIDRTKFGTQLYGEEGGKEALERYLIPDAQFNPREPFRNQGFMACPDPETTRGLSNNSKIVLLHCCQ